MARIYRRGQSVRAGTLGLKYAANHLGRSRLGVVVSKKVSKSAPKRNRIRRRIYGYYRQQWQRVVPGHDLLISVFSSDIAELPAAELDKQLVDLLAKAKLWVEPPAA